MQKLRVAWTRGVAQRLTVEKQMILVGLHDHMGSFYFSDLQFQ